MWFWLFMLICNCLIPILMFGFGWVMLKHPPQKINSIYGYRTTMSMKNMATWQYAHEVCGRIWWKIGWILFFLSLLVMLPFRKSSEGMVGSIGGVLCTTQCIILVATIFPVEKALKKKFNLDGTEK